MSKKDKTITMNTFDTIVNSIVQSINENIIDDLTNNLGYDHDTAVKMVEEYEGFSFELDAEKNPVIDF